MKTHYSDEFKLEILKALSEGKTPTEVSRLFNVPRSTVRDWRDVSPQDTPVEAVPYKQGFNFKKCVITSYIVGSDINEYVWPFLEKYHEDGYSIGIIPYHAKSVGLSIQKTSVLPDLPSFADWVDGTYLIEEHFHIVNLQGMRQTSNHLSTSLSNIIYPHFAHDFHANPSMVGKPTKYTIGTGTISKGAKLYSGTPMGHTLRARHREACLVIDDNKVRFSRFADSDILGVVIGDVHLPYQHPDFFNNLDLTLQETQPEFVVLHDLVDFGPQSHHTYSNLLTTLNREDITDHFQSIFWAYLQLQELTKKHNVRVYVAYSNHDIHYIKGLLSRDVKSLTKDEATFYYALGYELVKNEPNPLKAFFNVLAAEFGDSLDPDLCTYINNANPLEVQGYELHHHGDKGANGSFFASKNLSKLGIKAIVGHTHSPSRNGDILTVGTSSNLDLGYNSNGFSSWSNSNVYLDSYGYAFHILELQ